MTNLPTWLPEDEYRKDKAYWDWIYGVTYGKNSKKKGIKIWSIDDDEVLSRNLKKIENPTLRYVVMILLKSSPRSRLRLKKKNVIISFLKGEIGIDEFRTKGTKGLINGFYIRDYKDWETKKI